MSKSSRELRPNREVLGLQRFHRNPLARFPPTSSRSMYGFLKGSIIHANSWSMARYWSLNGDSLRSAFGYIHGWSHGKERGWDEERTRKNCLSMRHPHVQAIAASLRPSPRRRVGWTMVVVPIRNEQPGIQFLYRLIQYWRKMSTLGSVQSPLKYRPHRNLQ